MAAILTGFGLGKSFADADVIDMDSLPRRLFLPTPLINENEISDSVPTWIVNASNKNLKYDHIKSIGWKKYNIMSNKT